MKRIGIKDLARLLSLNVSTISRALSGHPDVSPETRERVLDAAREFNYHPNLHARFFRKKNSGLIALVLPELNSFFIPELIQGVHDAVEKKGYNVIMFISGDSPEKEAEIMDHCLSWVAEGVLVSVSNRTVETGHFRAIQSAGIPLVMLDKVIHTADFSTVTINDHSAAWSATEHLIRSGCRKLLGVLGNPGLEITRERAKGFADCLEARGFLPEMSRIITIENIASGEEVLMEEVIRGGYDGIFVMSDELLLFVYPALAAAGLYPLKIRLAAISDGKLPHAIFPQVPYVQHSGYQTGRTAAEKLLDEISGKDPAIRHFTSGINLVHPR